MSKRLNGLRRKPLRFGNRPYRKRGTAIRALYFTQLVMHYQTGEILKRRSVGYSQRLSLGTDSLLSQEECLAPFERLKDDGKC